MLARNGITAPVRLRQRKWRSRRIELTCLHYLGICSTPQVGQQRGSFAMRNFPLGQCLYGPARRLTERHTLLLLLHHASTSAKHCYCRYPVVICVFEQGYVFETRFGCRAGCASFYYGPGKSNACDHSEASGEPPASNCPAVATNSRASCPRKIPGIELRSS